MIKTPLSAEHESTAMQQSSARSVRLGQHLAITTALCLSLTGCALSNWSFAELAPTRWFKSNDGAASHAVPVEDYAALRGAVDAALKAGDVDAALTLSGLAVEADHTSVAAKRLHARTLIAAARLEESIALYRSLIAADPTDARAQVGLALAYMAVGDRRQAEATIAGIDMARQQDSSVAIDVGLAHALAGRQREALAILEAAARAPDADSRARQNLALAYVIGGEWMRGYQTALLDLTPDVADARLQNWGQLAQQREQDRVATLLGIEPQLWAARQSETYFAARSTNDIILAGNFAGNVVAGNFSGAQPSVPLQLPASMSLDDAPKLAVAPVTPVAPRQDEPRLAFAQPAVRTESPTNLLPQTVPWSERNVALMALPPAAPARDFGVARVRLDESGKPLATIEPVALRTPDRAEPARRAGPVAASHWVVQLGAFGEAARAEKAWQQLSARVLASGANVTEAVVLSPVGDGLYRVAVSGFDNRDDAVSACAALRDAGIDCMPRRRADGQDARLLTMQL